jgi:hypothetical protein
MPQVGFELTIPVFERVKTVHALDRAATVIGTNLPLPYLICTLLCVLKIRVLFFCAVTLGNVGGALRPVLVKIYTIHLA